LGDYSIWEGWEIEGWPVTTVLRGKVMVENGQFYGNPTDGRFIPRKIDSLILSRPAC
jgi:dihydropyrimidinase